MSALCIRVVQPKDRYFSRKQKVNKCCWLKKVACCLEKVSVKYFGHFGNSIAPSNDQRVVLLLGLCSFSFFIIITLIFNGIRAGCDIISPLFDRASDTLIAKINQEHSECTHKNRQHFAYSIVWIVRSVCLLYIAVKSTSTIERTFGVFSNLLAAMTSESLNDFVMMSSHIDLIVR